MLSVSLQPELKTQLQRAPLLGRRGQISRLPCVDLMSPANTVLRHTSMGAFKHPQAVAMSPTPGCRVSGVAK